METRCPAKYVGVRAARVWESRSLPALIKATLRNELGLFALRVGDDEQCHDDGENGHENQSRTAKSRP
jgi:hypothetical protein